MLLLFGLLALVLAPGQLGAAAQAEPVRWLGAWASAQQETEPHNSLDPGLLEEFTLRQIVRVSAGGKQARLHISNSFGTEPLKVRGAALARARAPDSPATEAGSSRTVRFNGATQVTIPAGAVYVSDPVRFDLEPFDDLAVSLEISTQSRKQTGHPGSRATSYVVPGRFSGALDLPKASPVDHWYFLSAIDVDGAGAEGAVVVFGDSITDGFGVAPNSNGRWTDALARRLYQARPPVKVSVLNLGLGGNRILADGLGPNAASRFSRDALSQAGVTHVIMLIGVNDLGMMTRQRVASPDEHADLVAGITGALHQMSTQARERGVTTVAGTIMPFARSDYYRPPAETERDRNLINDWIRTSGAFDHVIDFDLEFRDPAAPNQLRKDLDGDGLHPSLPGYQAMANLVPLQVFGRAE